MFRIKNANRIVVNLRTLFPKQKITRAFETSTLMQIIFLKP